MKLFLNPLLGMLILSLFSTTSYGQSWKETKDPAAKSSTKENSFSKINTTQHKNFQVNYSSLKNLLHKAPMRTASNKMNDHVVKFPNAQGQLESYQLQRVRTMHPDLAAKYPGIASYMGYNIKDATKTIRITETPNGIHATLHSNKNTSYITPTALGGKTYKVYDKNAIIKESSINKCLIGQEQTVTSDFFNKKNSSSNVRAIADGKFRTLRMAIVTTGEFSKYYIDKAKVAKGTTQEKKAAVMAGLNTLLNTLNGLYEREFAISMVLVPNNDKIIFLDPKTDGLSNPKTQKLLDEGNKIIYDQIGDKNFDIGHTMMFQNSGGSGQAQLSTPCSSDKNKGRAVSGSGILEGDNFIYGIWAHEIGHQFAGNHTFNNSCGNNRNNSSAVEPGSGSTIMSYAGACAPNIQLSKNSHFHGYTHKEISNYIIERVNPSNICGVTITENTNSAPVISQVPNYTIPTNTPFVLSANATDADNDVLTYQFDQMDNEIGTAPPIATATNGPVFKSIPPSSKAFRYFPSMSDILANNLTPEWEVIPSVSRTMKFTTTVRDVRNNLGSQSVFSDFKVNFVQTEPFKVTSQSQDNIEWKTGEQHEITWNVAGTTTNGIDTPNVTILLTTNGGLTFDKVLATSTPNDGSYTITIPDGLASSNARIMVKAIGNIFFSLNSSPITINTRCTSNSNDNSFVIPDGKDQLTSPITIHQEIGNISELKVSLDIEHTWVENLLIKLVHPEGKEVILWKNNCNEQDFNTKDLVFDDLGNIISQNCSDKLPTLLAPIEKLANLYGLKSSGTWKLVIQDNSRGYIGKLNSWKINICTGDVTNLGTTNYNTLKGTQIYPNPNNGVFTADFGKNNASVYQITLYDLLGRKVFKANYNNVKNLINVKNISKGNYLLLLETNGKKSVSKIIIE